MIVVIASLVQREVARLCRDGGIVVKTKINNKNRVSKTIPQSRYARQPPLHKGASLCANQFTTTNPDLSLKKQTSSAKALFSCFCRTCLFYFRLINPPLKLLCFFTAPFLFVFFIRYKIFKFFIGIKCIKYIKHSVRRKIFGQRYSFKQFFPALSASRSTRQTVFI